MEKEMHWTQLFMFKDTQNPFCCVTLNVKHNFYLLTRKAHRVPFIWELLQPLLSCFHWFSVPCRLGNSHLIIPQRHMNSVCTNGTCSMASQHGHCCMQLRVYNFHPLTMMKLSAYTASELHWWSRDLKPLRCKSTSNSLMNGFSSFLCTHNSSRWAFSASNVTAWEASNLKCIINKSIRGGRHLSERWWIAARCMHYGMSGVKGPYFIERGAWLTKSNGHYFCTLTLLSRDIGRTPPTHCSLRLTLR